jgi:hypothetical protein
MAATAADVHGDPFADEAWVRAGLIFRRDDSVNIRRAIDSVPWGIVAYWPIEPIAVVIVSVADPDAFVADYTLSALAWNTCYSGRLYQHVPRVRPPVQEEQPDPHRRGPRGLDHAIIHDDILRGFLTVEQICVKYSVSRQTLANIRKKFGTDGLVKRARGRPRLDQAESASS